MFLDEIAALPHHVQASLLRALQFKIIKRVGGNTFDRVDARIIAATNQDINDTKTFRPDLRYRLGEPVVIPPLRHRKEDIPALAAHFLAVAAALQGSPPDTIAYDALQSLLAYSWPGNIRELETVLQFCSAVCENGEIKLADLPTRFRASEVSGKKSEISDIPSDPSDLRPLTSDLSLLLTPLPLSDWTANQERAYIESVRDRCGGDAKAASAVLQISPATFYRKLGRVPS